MLAMKLLVPSLLSAFALLVCLALPACSGASGGGLGANDGGSSSSSSSSGGSSSGSGGSSSSSGGGGNTTCAGMSACGTEGKSYQVCTTLDATTHACKSIDYKTSDGHDFDCNCDAQSCGVAVQKLQSYCANPDGDGGSGNTTCTPSQPCGSTGSSYQQCTTTSTGGACLGISYKLSNGITFQCASCGDCSGAVSSLDSYCQGGGTPMTTCTASATCATSDLTYQECTTTLNGTCTGMYYQTSDLQTFTCAACGNCSAASGSMESYCSSMSTMTSCGSPTACGSTGVTYQSCTMTQSGSCTEAYYSTSDGNQFTCNSCSDCSSAITSLDSYCASLGGTACGGLTCSSGYLCCNCSGADQCLSSNSGTYTCATYLCTQGP